MHLALRLALALSLAACAADAAVVRLAPDFGLPGPGNKTRSLRSFRGQPVVLVIAPSPDSKAFRKQMKYLRRIYQEFAARKVVFVAAFTNANVSAVQSDVPFAIVNNGAAVAAAYGVKDFSLVVIGKDGNVDYQTDVPRLAERIRDVVQNSYEVQAASRKSTSGPQE